ncbi:MAG TPA: citramalate synthase [bacterium]|nr:citramalate synthase [bacterium]HPR87057.1 citramalate synthase [bacterium]
MPDRLIVYDTTLRDGGQSEGIAFSADDKVKIAQRLDAFGADYIEGGWPGSNPKDLEFFRRAAALPWKNARIAAFGSTRRVHTPAGEDPNLRALLEAETPVTTIFGKSWDLHVIEGLRTTLEENLNLIRSSVAFLHDHGKEVIYDAEHFFDGYVADPEYALTTLAAARQAGAACVVLCDTNGGTLTLQMAEVIRTVMQRFPGVPLGLHAHNDSDAAVASSLAALALGVQHIQGTINGYGERCGNANLCSIIAGAALKMNLLLAPAVSLQELTSLSRYVSEIANLPHREESPYVGNSAFAHKAGIHVSAIQRNHRTYEHVDPERVGNHRRVLVSDQSGQSNILYKAAEMGVDIGSNRAGIRALVEQLKEMEYLGYQFEGADGSLEVLIKKTSGRYSPYFSLESARVIVDKSENGFLYAEAILKIKVGGEIAHTAAEGHGPVDALDQALRKALLPFYPDLQKVKLVDYKVRVLDSGLATAARVRVLIESSDGGVSWGTVGVSENIIEASWQALADGIDYYLMRTIGTA